MELLATLATTWSLLGKLVALICAVQLSATSYAAGSTPPPAASIVAYNPTNTAICITGVQLTRRVYNSSTLGNPVPMGSALPPYGPGAPVVVPALGTQTVGPFAITVANSANANGGNFQGSSIPVYTLMIGATVYGSDRSINNASELGLTVGWTIRPPPNTQGGSFIFSSPSNSLLLGFL